MSVGPNTQTLLHRCLLWRTQWTEDEPGQRELIPAYTHATTHAHKQCILAHHTAVRTLPNQWLATAYCSFVCLKSLSSITSLCVCALINYKIKFDRMSNGCVCVFVQNRFVRLLIIRTNRQSKLWIDTFVSSFHCFDLKGNFFFRDFSLYSSLYK